MPGIRPYVLSIAGFDTSGGAGVIADAKAFEQCEASGLAICTAMTLQTENKFFAIEWRNRELVKNEIKTLLENYEIKVIKFGLAESFAVTLEYIQLIRSINNKCFLLVDPIINTSSNAKIMNVVYNEFMEILDHIDLLTPNFTEMEQLSGMPAMAAAEKLSAKCAILLKGGHNPEDPGTDFLYVNGKQMRYSSNITDVHPKHGTGCVYSAAVCAYIAQQIPVEEACRRAKKYVEKFISSDASLTGYHV